MKFVASLILALALFGATAYGQELSECLEKDSISCIQRSLLYKRAKELFEKDSYELVAGVSLVKSHRDDGARRSTGGKAAKYEEEIEKASGIGERQAALENYISEEIGDFFTGRSLKVSYYTAAVSIVLFCKRVGRGKKKLLKSLWPVLILAKVKLGVLASLFYFGITLIAKKAIIASLISLAISAFIGLRNYMTKSISHDATAYSSGWSSGANAISSAGWAASPQLSVSSGAAIPSSGWAAAPQAIPGGGSGWEDISGAYSAQNQAYQAYRH
ncbi:unnamed protein product [Trichogramma brassicae]|uniref:Osiris 6 n=1 Tax=Trichogramma brassicae TaxID=86971 RepID=A0A6H5HXL6_9HYME|nr:unnamed protein product [Trichogramma brassicae]